MSKHVTRVYSDVAYQQRLPFAQPSVQIAAGKLHVVRVKAPSEARLTHIAVKQTDAEAQVIFEVEILKSQLPWPFPDQDVATGLAPADDVTLYRILAKQIGAAGFPIEVMDEATGYVYRNMDGNNTNNQRYIYVVIAPGGFGIGAGAPTSWKLRTAVDTDVG